MVGGSMMRSLANKRWFPSTGLIMRLGWPRAICGADPSLPDGRVSASLTLVQRSLAGSLTKLNSVVNWDEASS
jgi:hypothetical protein